MEVVTMPQLGETVTEGTITAWVAAIGDRIEIDDVLYEVSTEKVDTEIPAAAPGYLREMLVREGETVPIGTPVAVVTETPDEPYEFAPDEEADSPAETPPRRAQPERSGPSLSPVVRRLITEHGLDPAAIAGSGRDGRITRADVLAHAANLPARAAAAASIDIDDGDEIVPFSLARSVTAHHMRTSLDTAAHAHVSMAVDYSAVDRARGDLGYLPFVARAIIASLRAHPVLNAAADTDRSIRRRRINLGIAVDLGDALVVPVLHDADRLRLRALAGAIADLADRARRRRLDGDAFRGGTFTITNVGAHGTHTSTPILNRPQVGICSVDGIRPTPVAVADGDGWATAVHPVGHLSLGFDHRAVDGAAAAAFLATVRDHLEDHDWAGEVGP